MSTAIDLPPMPVAPEPGDCCGSGCLRCVHDVYDEALEHWRSECAALERRAANEGRADDGIAPAPCALPNPGPTG